MVKDECDRLGLPIVSLPCVAVGLIDFNPSVREFHVDYAISHVDENMILQPVFNYAVSLQKKANLIAARTER